MIQNLILKRNTNMLIISKYCRNYMLISESLSYVVVLLIPISIHELDIASPTSRKFEIRRGLVCLRVSECLSISKLITEINTLYDVRWI